jgi:hypothetical protein
MAVSAVLDACVLYPVGLRDTLLNVAEAGLYRVLWTEEILNETTRNIVDDTPGSPRAPRHHLQRHAQRLPGGDDPQLRTSR